jgi:hypothetical protein
MDSAQRWIARGSARLLLALLPALLVLPALGELVVWGHAHGPHGVHVHWLASAEDVGDARAHHARHTHEPARDATDGHERFDSAPVGLVVVLPRCDASPARVQAAPSTLGAALGQAAFGDSSRPRPPFPCGVEGRAAGPPARARRSGLAELLRGNHAILI